MLSIAMFMSNLVLLMPLLISLVASEYTSFTYHGFRSANVILDGTAEITSNGLLKLTNNDTARQMGHAFYPYPVSFKKSLNGTASSFSTTFVFAIAPEYRGLGGHGIAFVIAPTRGLPGALPSQYLGLFNSRNNGNATNHVFAIELDTVQDFEFDDIDDNHVGIDINGLKSEKSATAGYYVDDFYESYSTPVRLRGGQQIQVWVEYDGVEKQINVTLAPLTVDKPVAPLLSLSRDLSPIIKDNMYVGFSSSTGLLVSSHYVLGWSFKVNGHTPELVIYKLPMVPWISRDKRMSKFLTIGLPVMVTCLVLVAISSVIRVIRRKMKFAELLDDWELDYGPQRFKYYHLFVATKGFSENELLGRGGFGKVYRGVLPTSYIEIAVKRISHESRQGMREFVAEIASMGRLRHRNLVPLLGYCRRKGELLLVYDYMPNGSLDKYLFHQPTLTLGWSQRFGIIKGVASGLFYLHEEWEQVVVHRDVKASNVMLDGELNARLGDFGLARFYDRGSDPQPTRVVGTLGYMAPELYRSGKATTSTDVFAFGAFLLEVACGRRPIERTEDVLLLDWVFSQLNRGEILEAGDPNLGTDYVAEEVELVLKLGLLCSNSEPAARPSMRQVVQFLEGDVPLPELPSVGLYASGLSFAMSYPVASMDKVFTPLSFVADSLLSGGR
ncbi:L-type lectin-domain containing receptor kinase IV.1-like [Corylus avellana]|uniref:L-type lectin-domain containing receptor kinase IV.1-like n=1 Tax=Corylus avellana TaxID=13451 RepID=UPI001E23B33B|nr:L-type lectin-domain containing receptor kinase IV.1-like [Corylus avellana]